MVRSEWIDPEEVWVVSYDAHRPVLVCLVVLCWLLQVGEAGGLLDSLHQVLEVDSILQLFAFEVVEWCLVGLSSIFKLAQLRVVSRRLVSGVVGHLLAERTFFDGHDLLVADFLHFQSE